jgi:DNA-binding CsgD family transcriptional regulator
MVEVAGVTTSELKLRADALLQAGRMVSLPAPLTRREEEVLRHVMQNLANKEIASALNLSERTVKFHVSALLAKFHVPNRVQLAQEGGRAMMPVPPPAGEANGAIPAVAGSTHFRSASGNDNRRSIRKGDVVQMSGRMTRV